MNEKTKIPQINTNGIIYIKIIFIQNNIKQMKDDGNILCVSVCALNAKYAFDK